MLQEYVNHVADVFASHTPVYNYGLLPDRSVRNRLLAHYLLRSVPHGILNLVLLKDTDKGCILKLSILDDAYLFVRTPHVREPPSSLNDAVLPELTRPGKLGDLNPKSSLDKVVAIVGLRLHRHLFALDGQGKSMSGQHEHAPHALTPVQGPPFDLAYPSQHEAFRDVSKGASPVQAAACYLQLLLPDKGIDNGNIYMARVIRSQSSDDLRRLLAFRQYHERTVLPEVREENIKLAGEAGTDMAVVFLQAVMNWHRDVLERLVRGSR